MVSKITVARIPPAMTTVPADIRNPLHQQPAGRKRRAEVGRWKEDQKETMEKVKQEGSAREEKSEEEDEKEFRMN
ncbi:hypothetical protein CesoFtcFv8_003261 [Champsocephalus esox]|uniref:Uncharacterized protein n=2 Tax=Champsocephalus TaxID=52236 RepID=A0AAN8HXF8_CHAGU|nr:hypothetical protein CesoFtcFv8_003261 [Champsocephalus esox]KAK5931941.1 hypothetical protein CgunFtcFv8_003689 [Champsocephalus gunnari]